MSTFDEIKEDSEEQPPKLFSNSNSNPDVEPFSEYHKINNIMEDLRKKLLKSAKKPDMSNKLPEGIHKNKFPVMLDSISQIMRIGLRPFRKFDDLFELLRVKEDDGKRKSQIKGGISLLYAIARYGENNIEKENMLIVDLLEYYKEFKKEWINWSFDKKGREKEIFSKTDCDTAKSILSRCHSDLGFKILNKKEILITK